MKRPSLRKYSANLLGHLPFNLLSPRLLSFRFGESDLRGWMTDGVLGQGDEISIQQIYSIIAEYVQKSGPNPIHVWAMENGHSAKIAELLRFAHRLDCPTKIVLTGENCTRESISRLLHSGVDEIWMIFGGLSHQVHEEVTALNIEDSVRILHLLLEERAESKTKICIAVPWVREAPKEMSALRDWAMELGVDKVQVHIPYFGADIASKTIPNHPRLSAILEKTLWERNDRQPGWKKQQPLPCPVGNRRLEIASNGRVCSCPFKTPVEWKDESFVQLWKKLSSHRKEISHCKRMCWHPELQYLRLS